jgi:hypothetical protein
MLNRLRWHARETAAALIVAIAALSLPHSLDPHHDADNHGVVIHDASGHRIGGPESTQDDHPLHCLACHLARSSRLRPDGVQLGQPDPQPATLVRAPSSSKASGPSHAQPSLRAPPASPAFA